MSVSSFSTRRRFRLAAACLLIVGVVAAAAILIADTVRQAGSSGADTNLPGYSTKLDDNRRELAQVERLGGKVSVLTVEFHQWFLSLWEGRRLAWTLLVLAAVSAWLCWHVADLVDEDESSRLH